MRVKDPEVFLRSIDTLAACSTDLVGIADILRLMQEGDKAVDLESVREFLAGSLDRLAEIIRKECDRMQQTLSDNG